MANSNHLLINDSDVTVPRFYHHADCMVSFRTNRRQELAFTTHFPKPAIIPQEIACA